MDFLSKNNLDVINSILFFCDKISLHMLHFVNKLFHKLTKSNRRCLTTKSVIKSKSLHYLKYIQDNGVAINVTEHLMSIVCTNSLSFIKTLVDDFYLSRLTKKNIDLIIRTLDLEVIVYCLSAHNSHQICSNSIISNRLDVLTYFYDDTPQSLLEITQVLNDHNLCSVSLDILKFCYNKGYVISTNFFINNLLTMDLKYISWVLDHMKVNRDFLSDTLSEHKRCSENKEVVKYLHDKKIYCHNNLYEFAVCNKILHQFPEEDLIPCISLNILIYHCNNVKNIPNEFTIDNIIKYVDKNDYLQILYCAIVNNREDIYYHPLFSEYGDIDNIKILCKLEDNMCLCDTISKGNGKLVGLKSKYIDVIVKQNDMMLLETLVKYVTFDIKDIVKFYKRGKLDIVYFILQKVKLGWYRYILLDKYKKYVCKSNDSTLFYLIIHNNNNINKHDVIRWGSIKLINIYLKIFPHLKLTYDDINTMLMYRTKEDILPFICLIDNSKLGRACILSGEEDAVDWFLQEYYKF